MFLSIEINWGSSVQAHTYRRALEATLKLENVQEHVKNFRPQMLVLTGNPISRPALVDLASLVTHGNSLMICGNFVQVRRFNYIVSKFVFLISLLVTIIRLLDLSLAARTRKVT